MKCNSTQKRTVYEVSAIQKRYFFPENPFLFSYYVSYFCTLFSKNCLFATRPPFFESLITHKRFVFKESYISYGKRQKSCTLIVIWVKCLYLTYPTFNSSAKSNRLFLLQRRKYFYLIRKIKFFCTIFSLLPGKKREKKIHLF